MPLHHLLHASERRAEDDAAHGVAAEVGAVGVHLSSPVAFLDVDGSLYAKGWVSEVCGCETGEKGMERRERKRGDRRRQRIEGRKERLEGGGGEGKKREEGARGSREGNRG